jgi:hypothetical protein
MQARVTSMLSCGHLGVRGNLIVKIDGQWICWPCRAAQIKDLDRVMQTPPRPSGRGDNTEGEETA